MALFGLILGDAVGVPVPGDTALILAGGLAADGKVSLVAVVLVASIAAFLGDLVLFSIGRRGGRRILLRDGRLASRRRAVLHRADRFYARHGITAVFLGKFIPGVRAVSSLTAGSSQLHWRTFALVDGAACLSWTAAVASLAYAAGPRGALAMVVLSVAFSVTACVFGASRRVYRARATNLKSATAQAS